MTELPQPFGQGKRTMFALFNRLSGAFVLLIGRMGDEPPCIDDTHYQAREVEIDPDTEMVVGTVDNFEVRLQADQPPVIDEYTLNARCRDKILKRYPLHSQLNLMANLLDAIVEQLQPSGDAVTAYRDMRSYIAECQVRNDRYKTAYEQNPDFTYVDKAALEQRVLDELEGGLHEVIGGALSPVDTPFG